MKPRRPKNIPAVDPDFLQKQQAALVRNHRQVIYFNEKEMDAINEYCRRLKIKAKATMLRTAILEKVLSGLDKNHPTLFEDE